MRRSRARAAREVALHEAGHAVVVVVLGGDVTRFDFELTELGPGYWAGQGIVNRIYNKPVTAEDECAADLAGYAAELANGSFARAVELSAMADRGFGLLLDQWEDAADGDPGHDYALAKLHAEFSLLVRGRRHGLLQIERLLERVWGRTFAFMLLPKVEAAVRQVCKFALKRFERAPGHIASIGPSERGGLTANEAAAIKEACAGAPSFPGAARRLSTHRGAA